MDGKINLRIYTKNHAADLEIVFLIESISKLIGREIENLDAKDGEFPHQVSLKRATGSHYCGGSVIGPQYVLYC